MPLKSSIWRRCQNRFRKLKKARRLTRPPRRTKTRRSAGKAVASEEARRYVSHFVCAVRPFNQMDPGERISPSSVSDLRKTLFNVEPLSDTRTPLADFFSILLKVRSLLLR